ncbi:hypothetical protein DW993_08965 [Clostridium sp. AM51-4]|nr:hypothetical protein [Clostridium sp. AM51-4]RHQ05604.1 hypothetical protein DW993_08965 [Clostridium sp. AM51-4]RHQ13985.1 hypothetical protein DW974_15415 [Lachnospiraceae bacterium AM48-27BH]
MIETLWNFFRLYTADADYLPDFWLTMILLYLNAGLYLNDLYNLVKRKSKAETFSLMAIPGVFAVLFVSVLSIFAHVPNLQSTASQAKRLSLIITTTQPQTNLALLLIVFLYPILWGIGLLRQRRHEHGSRKRWVLSCIPDYIAWIILILGIGYHLFFGENILNSVLENARLEIYWPFMAPTEPGSIYGCMEFISLHVRKRYCLSAFYLNFCLCGFRFATTVGRMLLPLSAFIICFARMPFFVVSPYWKLRW